VLVAFRSTARSLVCKRGLLARYFDTFIEPGWADCRTIKNTASFDQLGLIHMFKSRL
jgi:hypothetical protein